MDRKSNRKQLAKCFEDLAERADELGENSVAIVSSCLAASIYDGSDEAFGALCAEYARMRIKQLEEEIGEEEASEESDENL